MTKLQSRFAKLLDSVAQSQQEVSEHLNEVTAAQNLSGVVVMTIFQMLIEKGVLDKEEIEARVEQNKQLALDEDGGCIIPLTSLLDDTGGQTDGDKGG
jgi:hypothetical protein